MGNGKSDQGENHAATDNEKVIMDMLANYRKEREAFEKLLDCDSYRILLLCGKSGMGKTTLLRAFEKLLEAKKVCYVSFTFKDMIVLQSIFSLIGDSLEWENLTHLSECISTLSRSQEPINVTVNSNRLIGMNIKQTLHLVLENKNHAERQTHWQQLTDSLSKDLRKLSQPLFILLDTYERVNSEIQEWVESFLKRIRFLPQLRIVIAGQQVPDENSIGYGNYTTLLKLEGVTRAEDWVEYMESRKCQSKLDAMELMKFMCHHYKGHPQEIASVIESLSMMKELL